LRIGAVWGLGHGISAIIMGMVAFFLKGRFSSYSHSTLIPKLSLYTEVLIGVSLIIIGLLGLKEAASFEAPAVVTEADGTTAVASSSGMLKKVRLRE
jgi:cytochrome c biogenesis protein CcdA